MPALALFAWSNLQHDLGAVLGFLGKLNVYQLGCIALALFATVQTLRLHAEQRHSHKVEAQLAKSDAARLADRQSYAKAQADAQAKNLATVAADKAQRERITHDISQSYESELASLRADLARRLRPQNPAAPSAPGNPGLPNVSPAPSGPDDASRVSIPTSLYVHGAELELQLERLQDWVRQQTAVDPNK